MKLREDDIWILSYPKCGTTWAIETVWLVMNDVRKEFSAISPPDPPKYFALTSKLLIVDVKKWKDNASCAFNQSYVKVPSPIKMGLE